MTDNLKESLSALIDGEASEIEVHRLLRQFEADASLKSSWISYLQVRAVARGEKLLSADQHSELHERISLAIDNETHHFDATPLKRNVSRRYVVPAAGLALAASLVIAVFVGVSYQTGDSSQAIATSKTPTAINAQPVVNAYAENQVVDFGELESQEPELRELDADQQRQLRAYLNQHDRTRMNPNVRTAMYEQPKAN